MQSDITIRNKSLALTLLVHGIIFLILLYVVLTTPSPPLSGGEGVIVNIGYVDAATGEEQPMSDNTTTDPEVERVKPITQTEQNKLATQDLEESAVVPIKENKKVVKAPVKKVSPVVSLPEKVKVTEYKPVVDPKSLYKGKTNNSKSQGTATSGTGDQGNPDGDPNSNKYGKSGSGNGSGDGNGTGNGSGDGSGSGVSFSLSGRRPIGLPKVNDNSQEYGKVVIDIVVDKNGKVITATGPARGSNTTSTNLVRKAREGALKTQFNPSPEGVEEQHGTMTFNFIVR